MLNCRRLVVVAVSLLTVGLGMALLPKAAFAQRGAQTQDATSLGTVTLQGKVGTRRTLTSQPGVRPKPLTAVQKKTLYKGRPPKKSITLRPDQLSFRDEAFIYLYRPNFVGPGPGASWATFQSGNSNSDSSHLGITFRAKAGQLYLFDISVATISPPDGALYTLSYEDAPGSTQTWPNRGGSQHLTAYVTAEEDGWLHYDLSSSDTWHFYSVEISEL